MTAPLQPGEARILKYTEAEYHADPCSEPSLSASIARLICDESPAHAFMKHPRLGGAPTEQDDDETEQDDDETKEQLFGKIVHAALLGQPLDGFRVLDCVRFQSKADKALRDEAIVAGFTPVKRAVWEDALTVVQAIGAKLRARGIEFTGQSELAIEWREEESGVLCRGRLDHVDLARGLIWDLKTSASAKPDKCVRKMHELGYDVQHAAYVSAVTRLRPALAGRVRMAFLFCSTKPPYAVTPMILGGSMRELGECRWAYAQAVWAACRRSGVWPEYVAPGEFYRAEAKPWALQAAIEAGQVAPR